MKRGLILNLKKIKILNYVNINKIILILSVTYIIGLSFGSFVLSNKTNFQDAAKNFFADYLLIHNTKSFAYKLLSCFLRYFLILFLYFISGSSMLGVVITPFITAWQGAFFGTLISFIYSNNGINGIAFNAVILIPPTAIFTVECFFAARYAIEFSLLFIKLTLPRSRPASLYINFKNYCKKYVFLISISLFSSIIEIILNILFLKYFNY